MVFEMFVDGIEYEIKIKLIRGQSEPAFFARPVSEEFSQEVVLIKLDSPATCLAESLMTRPLGLETDETLSVIQARLGIYQEDESAVGRVVSVQPIFISKLENESVMGFDDFILGRKRNTWTLTGVSDEYTNDVAIQACIQLMDDSVKEQLARAIYQSQINGDESTHVGQFMVTFDRESMRITGIRRVDFGALGRWSKARKDSDDFQIFHTSDSYAGFFKKQFGYDYMSYLVKDPIVQAELVRLWIHTNKEEFITKAIKRFDTQVAIMENFAKGNEELHRKTLSNFLHEVLYKGEKALHEEVDYEDFKAQVKEQFIDMATDRCEKMVEKARSERIKVVIAENLRGTIAQALIINLSGASTDLDKLISQLPTISTYAQLKTYIELIEKENEKAPNQHCVALLKILKPLIAELNPLPYDSASQYRGQMAELKTQEVPSVNVGITTTSEESASATATSTSTSEPSTPTGRTSPGGTSP